FFFHCLRAHLEIHSFPTRRSSDLDNNEAFNDQIPPNSIGSLDGKQVQNLFSLCRIWGFLKYYHPNVSDGSLNWDEQLFERISTLDRKSTRLNSSHVKISYAVFCLK